MWKSDLLYDMVDFYQREAAKASNQLYDISSSSNITLEVPLNWRSAVKLGACCALCPFGLTCQRFGMVWDGENGVGLNKSFFLYIIICSAIL